MPASFYPAASTRSTSQLGITRLMFQVNQDQSALQNLQEQLSTGRRVLKPSDDPGAAIRGLAAQRGQEFKSQTANNLQAADTILAATESTLAQAQDILNLMKGVSVAATSTTLSPEEIDAFGQQVKSGLDQMLRLSNVKFRDQYIFAGSDVRESPLEYIGETVRFHGNADELKTITDYSSTLSANVTGQDAFGVKSSRVVGTADLNASLTLETPLANLNRGEGIRRGAITISDGVEAIEVDLSTAYNLNDVVQKIESQQVNGRDLTATLTASGLNITYADTAGGLLRIGEVGSGNMASDLGINNKATLGLSPVTGTDLDPILTETSRVSQMFGGAGLPSPDSFLLSQGDKDYVITTDNLDTVEDLMNRIRLSGAAVDVGLDPTGRFLAIQSTESGSTLSIGENGSNLASRLGIRTFDQDTSIASLNFGQGVSLNEQGNDLAITRNDGTTFEIDLDGVQSVADVLQRVNSHVDNQVAATRVTAGLATVGNGITLGSPIGAQQIRVATVGGSQAAWDLGLVSLDDSTQTGSTSGANSQITGSNVSGVEVEGVFNSLLRLQAAVESGRPEDMIRVAAALEDDIQRLSLARGVVGTRQQDIDNLKELTADQLIRLEETESLELDADWAQVVSELSAREAALQASLTLMGKTTQLSLFNYI